MPVQGGRGRGAKRQSTTKTQALAMTQSFIGGGVKFLGTYEGGCQIWKQAEPDDVDVDDEGIED